MKPSKKPTNAVDNFVYDETNNKWVAWDAKIDVTEGGMSGAGTDGVITLNPANTWVQVPTTIPTSDYHMVVTKEDVEGTVRWSFSNGGTPSATNGNKFTGSNIAVYMANGVPIYMGSDDNTDTITYTTIVD